MVGGLTFATSSSRPSCFFHDGGGFRQFQQLHRPAAPPLRKKPISVKAITSSSSSSSSSSGRRRTALSTDWKLSDLAVPSTSMPNFQDLDTTNMLLRQRIVFLGSVVDDMTADFVVSQLLLLDAEDQKKDIKMFINSPGGSITAAMGIYDAMKLCKADISTICLGLAASMGAFLLASGTKGKRFCMPNARVMIHQHHSQTEGNMIDVAIRDREIMYHKVKLKKILSRITGKPEEQIYEDIVWGKFMNPWEAMKYGLVDAVIDDGKPGLVAPIPEARAPPDDKLWHQWKFGEGEKAGKAFTEEELVKWGQNGGTEKQEKKEEAAAPI